MRLLEPEFRALFDVFFLRLCSDPVILLEKALVFVTGFMLVPIPGIFFLVSRTWGLTAPKRTALPIISERKLL